MAKWRCARCAALHRPNAGKAYSRAPICRVCAGELTARGLRWCRRCDQARPVAGFHVYCRTCHAAYQRAYGRRNVERLRVQRRARQLRAAPARRAREARKKLAILRGER